MKSFEISKKVLLTFSLIGTVFFLSFLFVDNIGICASNDYSCAEKFTPIAQDISILFPLLLLTVVTYKMRDEVYRAWFRFAKWWVPVSVLITMITPTTRDWMYPIASKGGVAFVSLVIFSLVSFFIIVFKYAAGRK